VLEVVEAGGDAGGVEGPVEVEGPIGVAEGELVELRAEQPVVDLAGPLGNRENWRALRGATSVRTLSSSPDSRSQRCVRWWAMCARCARAPGPGRGTGRARAGRPRLVRARTTAQADAGGQAAPTDL
jgi:hypothetical protein